MSEQNRIPQHVAIIMDGNGRWAELRGKERYEGHAAGVEPVRASLRAAARWGVKYLTLSSTGKRMGTTSGSPIHFVGDPCSRVVYVTEGCLKADVAHALMHRTFVATLGANNTAKLDELFAFLHRNGTEKLIEAEGMDKYSNEMVEKGASKIYALAARHGMRCRRLTWNPNYKGIDDWQLALRRKEQKMKED